jgi:hypothetical protein
LISLTSAGYPVSGLTGYPAGQSGIRSDTGYKKGRIIRPADIRCIPNVHAKNQAKTEQAELEDQQVDKEE